MSRDTILVLLAGAVAAVFLLKMMRRRQAYLSDILKKYLDAQLDWARKRARAAAMARRAARQKAEDEKALEELMAETDGSNQEEFEAIGDLLAQETARS